MMLETLRWHATYIYAYSMYNDLERANGSGTRVRFIFFSTLAGDRLPYEYVCQGFFLPWKKGYEA